VLVFLPHRRLLPSFSVAGNKSLGGVVVACRWDRSGVDVEISLSIAPRPPEKQLRAPVNPQRSIAAAQQRSKIYIVRVPWPRCCNREARAAGHHKTSRRHGWQTRCSLGVAPRAIDAGGLRRDSTPGVVPLHRIGGDMTAEATSPAGAAAPNQAAQHDVRFEDLTEREQVRWVQYQCHGDWSPGDREAAGTLFNHYSSAQRRGLVDVLRSDDPYAALDAAGVI
jgi:hypothetical protein